MIPMTFHDELMTATGASLILERCSLVLRYQLKSRLDFHNIFKAGVQCIRA